MLDIEDILGKEMVSSDAKVVGYVEGVDLDREKWRVPSLRITINKGLEAQLNKKKRVLGASHAHIRIEAVHHISDLVTLNLTMDQISQAVLDESEVPVSVGDVIGKRVICRKGREIGVLTDFKVDALTEWSVPSFDVRLDKATRKDLDLKKSMMVSKSVIRMRTADIMNVGDMIMLKIDLDSVKDYLQNKPVARV
jgi:sporulation protein YlmC with PRC-barrel domain